jgi:predicted nucleotidyltransferase
MTNSIIDQILKLFDVKLLVKFGDRKELSSDIDILIISNDFDGISNLKRNEFIKRIDKSLDPLCLTTEQFARLKESNSSLYICIKKTLILLYGNKTAFF